MNTPQESSTGQGAHGRSAGPSGAEQTRRKVEDMADTATAEGKEQVDRYRNVAADKVDTVAESVDAAADKLGQDQQTAYLSRHVSDMADGLGRLSRGLREKSADEIMGEVTHFARENPGLFVAGAVALGFGIARFARASSPSHRHTEHEAGSAGARHGSASTGLQQGERSGARAGTSNIPGTVGNPARGNDTVDTTAPHGTRGTTNAVPGPAAGPGVSTRTETTLAGQGAASATGSSGTYTAGAAGSSASGATGTGAGSTLGNGDVAASGDQNRGRT